MLVSNIVGASEHSEHTLSSFHYDDGDDDDDELFETVECMCFTE